LKLKLKPIKKLARSDADMMSSYAVAMGTNNCNQSNLNMKICIKCPQGNIIKIQGKTYNK
jgi:hypothetical protein